MDNANPIAALWIGLALVASLLSIRVRISVALIEIGLGVIGGNFLGLHTTPWIDFLAAFGAILLTFLAGLGGLAQTADSEAVLPAYLIGLAVAGVFVTDRVLVHRMRATAFSLLTPFYFLKAGSLVSLPAIAAAAGLIGLFLAVKVGAKVIGVWPTARAFGLMDLWWIYEVPDPRAAFAAAVVVDLTDTRRDVTGVRVVARRGHDDREHLFFCLPTAGRRMTSIEPSRSWTNSAPRRPDPCT